VGSAGSVEIGPSTASLQGLSCDVGLLQKSQNTDVFLGVSTKYCHSLLASDLSKNMADYGLTEEWLRKELSVAKKTENEKRNQMKEFTNLKTEKKLQEYLTTNCEEMKLIDTYNTPLCSFNRATKDGEAVLFANAKPDAVSQMRGGASWELKGSSLVRFSFFLCSFFTPRLKTLLGCRSSPSDAPEGGVLSNDESHLN